VTTEEQEKFDQLAARVEKLEKESRRVDEKSQKILEKVTTTG
jgi:hypothetical protein